MGGGFIYGFLLFLIWAIWAVLNLWIWQKSKATGNLLMLGGSAVLAVLYLLASFGVNIAWDAHYWLSLFSLIALTAGFYLSVKPMVAAQLAGIGTKLRAGAESPKP